MASADIVGHAAIRAMAVEIVPPRSALDKEKDLLARTGSASNSDGSNIEGQQTDLAGEDGMEQFKTMRWWNVAFLMIAEVVSLGVLALPSAVAKLGHAPGAILIVGFGLIATYTGHTIGRFKLAHPSVQNMGDAGFILFGVWGRHIFGTGSIVFLVFIAAAHVLSFSIMMNVVTRHSLCTIVFSASGAALSFVLCLRRRLEFVSIISIVSLVSIVAAVFTSLVGVITLHPQGSATDVAISKDVPFDLVMVGVMDIVMAYAGNVAFFGFLSEMRQPAEFPKALYTLQGSASSLYILVAVAIYAFVGVDVRSPALSSAGQHVRTAAYLIAVPTIVVAGVINAHVGCSMIFRAVAPRHFMRDDWTSWFGWAACCAGLWTMAFCLAESIPHFDHLIGLMSALLGTWFTYGISGFLWLHMHKGCWFSTKRRGLLAVLNFGLIALASTLCILGTFACIKAIVSAPGGKIWSCVDNSG